MVNNCWLSGVVSSFSQQFFTWLCALQGSALKQAFKWTINSYENEFLHVHFHANQTHFHDSVCTGTHCETEAQGNLEMAWSLCVTSDSLRINGKRTIYY